MDAAAEGIWDWNLATGAMYFSPGYATMLGYAPGEQLGKRTRIWYTDDASDFDVGTAYRDLAQGRVHQREQEMVRKDGSHFWCRMSGSAIDAGDLARGTVWVLEDITEARRARTAPPEGTP